MSGACALLVVLIVVIALLLVVGYLRMRWVVTNAGNKVVQSLARR